MMTQYVVTNWQEKMCSLIRLLLLSIILASNYEELLHCNSSSHFYAPATKWGGHIALPLSVCTSVIVLSTVLVSEILPRVFDAGI